MYKRQAKVEGKTGVEMEALTGVSVALLTIYDLSLIHIFHTTARMKTNLASAPGKTTCLLVRLHWEDGAYTAEPVLGKSGLITTMTKADGYVIVDMNREGLKKGELVPVYRFL